jgi:hypothetical protein
MIRGWIDRLLIFLRLKKCPKINLFDLYQTQFSTAMSLKLQQRNVELRKKLQKGFVQDARKK